MNGYGTTGGATIAAGTPASSDIIDYQQGGGTNFSYFVKLNATTVAALPTCNSSIINSLAAVTDASSPTYNSSLTGGGSTHITVFCNGSAWTAH